MLIGLFQTFEIIYFSTSIFYFIVAAISTPSLYRRTSNAAIGAEHAAISRCWSEQDIAVWTLIEPLTGISGHGQHFRMAALRTGQQGFKLWVHIFC
jgi:hypothetical protein